MLDAAALCDATGTRYARDGRALATRHATRAVGSSSKILMNDYPTQDRDRAISLARSDPSAALTLAREISDPWFACQALAWVGRFWPGDDFETVINEAFEIGRKCSDPYRVVASAAWPVRDLIERGASSQISTMVLPLLALANEIPSFASRSEALFLLFQAAKPGMQTNWLPVLEELIKASFPTLHWRQSRSLSEAVLIVAAADSRLANDILHRLPESRLKTQIEKRLNRPLHPTNTRLRAFFWE